MGSIQHQWGEGGGWGSLSRGDMCFTSTSFPSPRSPCSPSPSSHASNPRLPDLSLLPSSSPSPSPLPLPHPPSVPPPSLSRNFSIVVVAFPLSKFPGNPTGVDDASTGLRGRGVTLWGAGTTSIDAYHPHIELNCFNSHL